MGTVGGGEILVILLVALIVLGPTKLPPAIRHVGKVVGEIRRIGQGFQQELREAAEPLKETTAALKGAAEPLKETTAALKAADRELREATRKPIEEMKDTLKAADVRNNKPASGDDSAAAKKPASGDDSAADKKPAPDNEPADSAPSSSDQSAPDGDTTTAADESGTGPDTSD